MSQSLPSFHYGVEEGLPASRVYESLQDHRGFIWFATEFGISRFDGSTFRTYTVQDGLETNDVWGLYEDSEHRIWIKSFAKSLYYIKDDRIHKVPVPYLMEDRSIRSIRDDGEGNCWLGYQDALLCLHKDGSVELHPISEQQEYSEYNGYIAKHPGTNKQHFFRNGMLNSQYSGPLSGPSIPLELGAKLIAQPMMDASGRWILFSQQGILRWDPVNDHIREWKADSLTGHQQGVFQRVMNRQEGADEYWIMSSEGVFVLNLDMTVRKHYDSALWRSFQQVTVDAEGNLWCTTDGDGVFFFPTAAIATDMLNYQWTKPGVSQKVRCVIADGKGVFLAGTADGVLLELSENGITELPICESSSIIALAFAGDGRYLAVGTHGRLAIYDKSELLGWSGSKATSSACLEPVATYGITVKNLESVSGPESDLLVASREFSGRLRQVSNEIAMDTLCKSRSYALCRGGDNYWIGRPNGVFKLDGKTSDVFALEHSSNLLRSPVLDLLWQSNGVLWVGTSGYGLFGYSVNDDRILAVPEMQKATVQDIAIDYQGRIWAATNEGVYCIEFVKDEPFSYRCRLLTRFQGLASNEANEVYCQGDTLIVATNRGVSVFKPFPWPETPAQPRIFIESVYSGPHKIESGAEAMFSYRNNDVSFRYSSPVFGSQDKVRYGYRLKGLFENWAITDSETMTFNDLPPGDYCFQVMASVSGDWEQCVPAEQWISIQPHWLQTLWFKIGVSSLIVLIISFFTVWRLSALRHRRRLQSQVSELQAQALQAQMNPHFIFNALNAIQSMVGAKRADDASEYLALFARLIRMNMELSGKQWVNLRTELDCVRIYLELEQMRFEGKLQYSIEADPDLNLDQVKVPSLLLHPFVENAVLHGILPSRNMKGVIQLRLMQSGEDLIVTIQDNGIGMSASSKLKKSGHRSSGIEMSRRRLALLYGEVDSQLQIASDRSAERGTIVTISIPIRSIQSTNHRKVASILR